MHLAAKSSGSTHWDQDEDEWGGEEPQEGPNAKDFSRLRKKVRGGNSANNMWHTMLHRAKRQGNEEAFRKAFKKPAAMGGATSD